MLRVFDQLLRWFGPQRLSIVSWTWLPSGRPSGTTDQLMTGAATWAWEAGPASASAAASKTDLSILFPLDSKSGPQGVAGAPFERQRPGVATAAATSDTDVWRDGFRQFLRRGFPGLGWRSRDWGHREREQASRARDDRHAPA